ncbi:MAG: IS200/IS605 family transposase [Abitibacteriaceae bacterium]|nr:IS200/IS605 family transposase [Abditibacteriaceae bacterium]MBV9866020.1 IS200/IS605 family transposase [Abditibacteriaceae bacterium]
MRRSKTEIYLHLVWATAQRKQIITTPVERLLYRCIQNEVQHLGCTVLALGGMPDHIHLVVQTPATISVAKLAQQVKGVSSTFARDQLTLEEPFQWQDNYAAFSISRSHLKRVVAYVRNQKQHHAAGRVWQDWEESDEEVQ